jgi:hypothetical protein
VYTRRRHPHQPAKRSHARMRALSVMRAHTHTYINKPQLSDQCRHRDCRISDDVLVSILVNAHLFVPVPMYLQSPPVRMNLRRLHGLLNDCLVLIALLDDLVLIPQQTCKSLRSNLKRPRKFSPVPCAPACAHILSRASTRVHEQIGASV